jgi:hypothetical protein
MTGGSIRTPFFRSRKRAIGLTAIMVMSALIVHTMAARAYYSLNSRNLQLVATMAVRAGAEYLPKDPRGAIQIASRFVRHCGVASSEIISTDVSADDLYADDHTLPEGPEVCFATRAGPTQPVDKCDRDWTAAETQSSVRTQSLDLKSADGA